MQRPKIAGKDQLKHLLRIRVSHTIYQRLTSMQKQSDCRSICEIARKILSKVYIPTKLTTLFRGKLTRYLSGKRPKAYLR